MKNAISRMLAAIKVECMDEFDRNFDRQAFFSRSWQRRKSPINARYKTLHGPQATLRRSLKARVENGAVVFSSDLPYAAIHNEGGEIRVTPRMRRFFWAKYYAARGSFGYRKDGRKRQNKRNAYLTEEAAFWRAMALKPVGSSIQMPRRQFLGTHPKLEQLVREIIEENVEQALGGLAQGMRD